MMKKIVVILLAAMLLSATASAGLLLSEDFEDPMSNDSDAINTFSKGLAPAGWIKASQGYNASQNGINLVGANQVYSFRYTNSGLTSGPGMIGGLDAALTYTVSFDVSGDDRQADGALELGYNVQLVTFPPADPPVRRDDARSSFATLTVLTSASGNAPEDGSSATVSFDFTVDPEVAEQLAAVGQDLAVRILGSTNSANIDNVSVSAIPEPATLALLGIGGLLLRRKR